MVKQVLIAIHIYMEMNLYDIKYEHLGLLDIVFIDGDYFKGKKINLSSLYVQISGTVRDPKVLVIYGNNTE